MVLGLPTVVQDGSGPLTNSLAFEAPMLRQLIRVAEPSCAADPRYAASMAALDYLEQLRPAALTIAATIQTGGSIGGK